MRKNISIKPANEIANVTFPTIDDLAKKLGEANSILAQLAAFKHPLAVRRGMGKEVKAMAYDGTSASKQIRAGASTYFLDIEEARNGKKYLRITESRFMGEGKERERSSIV